MMISIKKKIIDIFHLIIDIQNDIRLSCFLEEFSKADARLMDNPSTGANELKYIDSLLHGEPFEEELKPKMKEFMDKKSIEWMKASYLNKNLDVYSKRNVLNGDIICILMDIILF